METMVYQLRPYQQQCLDVIRANYSLGITRMACSLPTGAGKTVILASIPKHLGFTKRCLVLAHRTEILQQTAEKLRAVYPDETIAIDNGQYKSNGERFVVSSTQLLGRGEDNSRLKLYNPNDFDMVCADEGHHFSSVGNQRIINYFTSVNKRCLIIGFSATWNRFDKADLSSTFGDIVFSYTIQQAIEDGFLVPKIEAYKVSTNTDISEVTTNNGDFSLSSLSEAVNVGDRNKLIVAALKKHIGKRSTLVFAVDVEHTKELNKLFLEEGFSSAVVVGETPSEERAQTIDDFMDGKLQIICNCMCLTEGTDLPIASCIAMCRPTQSSLLYTQQIGRGFRPHESKDSCLVLDFVDNLGRHKIQTSSTLFGTGLSEAFDFKGASVLDTIQQVEKAKKLNPMLPIHSLKSLDEIEIHLKQVVDLFDFKLSYDVERLSSFQWQQLSDGTYCLSIEKNYMLIKYQGLGCYKLYHNNKELEGEFNFYDSFRAADRFIKQNFPRSLALLKKSAKWHEREITPSQENCLLKFGVPREKLELLNRKQAQLLITKFILSRKTGVSVRY